MLLLMTVPVNAAFHGGCRKPTVLESLANSFVPGRYPAKNGIDRGSLLLCELEDSNIPAWVFKGCGMVRDTPEHKAWLQRFRKDVVSPQFDNIISMGEYCHATLYFYIREKEWLYRVIFQMSYEIIKNDDVFVFHTHFVKVERHQ